MMRTSGWALLAAGAIAAGLLAAGGAGATEAGATEAGASKWDGSWALDAARSTKGAAAFAAPGYVFAIMPDGRITWRIPAIGEVATGRTDGTAMAVHRTRPTPGLTLAVRADGPWTLHYVVARNGIAEGAGLMRLVEGGRAWVDLSWRVDKPVDAGELVYVRTR